MIKTIDIKNMESFTVENFQKNFDELMERVEDGESFIIKSECGNVAIVPCGDKCEELEDLIRLYTEHDEGC